jgi:threonylcarbamoyladenosine tRNA methylthiotransferase MtaB
MHGWTENYVRVEAKYDPLLINTTKDVSLVKLNENGLAEVQELALALETT